MFRQSLLTAVAFYLTLVSAQGDCKYYHTSCSASQYGVHECSCGGDGIVSHLSLPPLPYRSLDWWINLDDRSTKFQFHLPYSLLVTETLTPASFSAMAPSGRSQPIACKKGAISPMMASRIATRSFVNFPLSPFTLPNNKGTNQYHHFTSWEIFCFD